MNELLERLRERVRVHFAEAGPWCDEGRFWPPRALLLLYCAYALVRHLQDPEYQPLIGALDFGLHELGHVITRPFGEFFSIMGGSLVQCLVPVIAFFMFVKQGDYFAQAFTFAWLSSNLFYVAWYCSDARTMEIPLLSIGGGDAYHDWNYLLEHMGLLRHDKQIAFLMRAVAVVSMLVFLVAGGWLTLRMARTNLRKS